MISINQLQDTSASGNIYIDALTFRDAFLPGTTITYVLQGSAGDTGANGGALWAAEGRRTAFNSALHSWSAVANISFIELAGPYDGSGSTGLYDWIEQYSALDSGTAGQHDLPHSGTMTGTFNSSINYFTAANNAQGGVSYAVFVHEIGHGLGLLHPHNDGDEAPGDPVFPGVNSFDALGDNNLNQGIYTAMTYNGGYEEVGISPTLAYGWEIGPMAFDIAVVQRLYGANTATATGANTYALPTVNAAGTGWRSIWDAGGTDTISAAGQGLDAIIDLRAATLLDAPGGGGFVSRIGGVLGGVTIANGAVIENATGGSGDDRIHGNSAANRLDGGAGFDTADYSGVLTDLVIDLAGGTASGDGSDTLVSMENAIGGSGNDILRAFAGTSVTNGAQDVVKARDVAIATRQSALDLDYRFSAHTGDASVQAAGGAQTVTVHGAFASSSEYYSFYAGSSGTVLIDIDNSFAVDTIVRVYDAAGNLLGTDDDHGTLDVGSANVFDSYLSFNLAQGGQRLTVEVAALDGIYSNVSSYDLTISLASARTASGTLLLGSVLDGGEGNDQLFGAAGADTLYGGAGADMLAGADGNDLLDGGAGADTMDGGSGDDTYIADDLSDIASETVVGGTDTVVVRNGASVTLGSNIERLIGGSGTGNALDNMMIGSDANDRLDGGAGADRLYGGNGDDTYLVDVQNDLVFEFSGGGYDRVTASGSYYLYDGIEQLTLTGAADTFAVGNALDNLLVGGDGGNLLLGGLGKDILEGGAGNDLLFGQDGADSLSGGIGVDYLVGGIGDDLLVGDQSADALYGEDGNDTLYADSFVADPYAGVAPIYPAPPEFVTDILVGGAGNDTLHADNGLGDYDLIDGGPGDDIYWVDTGDDLTFEAAGGGTDIVHADVRVANAGVYLYANVENLVLVGTTAFGVGNALANTMTGSASANWLLGGGGNDTLNGKAGGDVLFGEAGADTFVFERGTGGDVIGDFQHGADHIDLRDFGVSSFAQLKTTFVQDGAVGAIILGGGDLIVLHNVTMAGLTADDFILV